MNDNERGRKSDTPSLDDREATAELSERTPMKKKGDVLTMTIKEATLKITALHCSSCVNTVKKVLTVLPSVEGTQADPEAKLVQVHYDESAVSLDQIRETLDEVGYSVED